MITAVYRPNRADILLIDADTSASLPVPVADVPALVDGLCEAFGVPLLAARLAGDPGAQIPARDFWSAV
jgi:hypothetical protein